ncbi:hypothetical protein Q3G72_011460 [Acer saccharum]|nr:hypothetical protein Q3G72_011460 [Acer saccharum]
MPRNAPTDARHVFAQHEAGRFLLGYLLGVLQKAYKAPSIEALRQGNFGMSLQSCDCRFEPQCIDCPCMQVAIPRMLKKDTGQLDDRKSLVNASVGNCNGSQKLAQLLIVPHSQLDMSRHNTVLLVVSCCISSKLQHL